MELTPTPSLRAELPNVPEPDLRCLTKLLDKNEKWAEANPDLFPMKPQTPKFLWIGCSDSRVPESVITDSRPGDIFTHRNIANQFHHDDDNAVSVLAYAVGAVKVQHVIVVGHTDCGGIKACADAAGTSSPPFSHATALDRWLAPLKEFAWAIAPPHVSRGASPSAELAADANGVVNYEGPYEGDREFLAALTEANVRKQVANVLTSEVLAREWAVREVYVHGWVFDLENGRLRDLGVSAGRRGPVLD